MAAERCISDVHGRVHVSSALGELKLAGTQSTIESLSRLLTPLSTPQPLCGHSRYSN
jgi:hypothetical protein